MVVFGLGKNFLFKSALGLCTVCYYIFGFKVHKISTVDALCGVIMDTRTSSPQRGEIFSGNFLMNLHFNEKSMNFSC